MSGSDRLPRRVSVVGSTGTGKTTYGRALAVALDVPFVELDALNWAPGWTMVDEPTFQARVREAIAGEAWVVDGNYGGRGAREMVWERADTVVWLDFSLAVILARLWGRTIDRIHDRQELWPGTGNRETIRNAFFSRGSLFWWALKTYRLRKRNYGRFFADARYAGKHLLRFTRPRDADAWLATQRDRVAERT